jgi:glycerol uptake operon antiterminator
MKEQKDLLRILKDNPIIPCSSNFDELLAPEYKDIQVILLYDLSIFDLLEIARKNKEAGKIIILNLDTIKGLANDEYGLSFIKKYLKINIIATSSPKIINFCKKLDFKIIQTIFLFDTKSLMKGIQLVQQGKPDMVDIRPGISVLRTTELLEDKLNGIPIICSGFIRDQKDIDDLLGNRVTAVTTSNKKLWSLYLG